MEFGVKPLFQDVSFVVNDRDRIALVGKNGAGKSTMLKILCGQQKPTAGVVSVPTDCHIGYLLRGELKDVPKGHDCYELYKMI